LTYDDPTSANLATWSNAATINGTRFLASDVGAFDATHASYPMRVRTAGLNSSISQSSPFPCDANVILVAFVPTVDLLLACFPSLSITGLTGSATMSSTISVDIAIAGTTETWSNNASWSQEPGELVVEILGAAASSVITADQSVVVSFILHNRNSGQAAPAISTLGVTLRLDDSTHAHDAHAASSITYPGADLSSLNFAGKSSCAQQPGDADPLFVRPVKFTSGSIAQSSATPCDSNVITVSVTTDGPLFADCVSAVTLAGLAGSTTATTAQFSVNASPSVVSSTALWNTAGTLILSTISTWQGCEAVSFDFNLTNPRTPQVSGDSSVSFTASSAGLLDAFENLELVKAADSNAPLYVVDTSWTTASIASSSTAPCDDNILTVVLRPSVPLLCTGITFVIGSLGSSRTPDNSAVMLLGAPDALADTALWTQLGGILSVTPALDILASTTYTFQLKLLHADSAQPAVTGISLQIVGEGSESLFPMTGRVDATTAVCGDGILGGVAECDDGNDIEDDGCSSSCTVEHGYSCAESDACSPSTCSKDCGDGKRGGNEACDDGNIVSEDGCSAECTVECGFFCDLVEPQTCASECGDGILASDEACDDGNSLDNDGCSSCIIESGWDCILLQCETTTCTADCLDGQFQWLQANISQSTCGPCQANIMTVAFKANSIMSTVCGSNITIAGLTNAIAPDGHMDVGSSLFKSVCEVESGGTWDNTRKELVLVVNRHIEADTVIVVTFEMKNPATPQSCPQIVLSHGLHNEAHQVAMSQDPGSSCAMHVCSTGLDAAYAVQKSSIPCDDNIVCVTFSLNASLVHDCSPVLTLSGLPVMISLESTFISRVPESAFPASFQHTLSASFLTVTPVDGLAAHTNFILCFTFVNDKCARTHASLSLQINFNDQVVVDRVNLDSNYQHCVPRSSTVFPKLAATTQVQMRRSVEDGMLGFLFTQFFNKLPPANIDDLRPFCVRADEYVVVSMVQSSAMPCDGRT